MRLIRLPFVDHNNHPAGDIVINVAAIVSIQPTKSKNDYCEINLVNGNKVRVSLPMQNVLDRIK